MDTQELPPIYADIIFHPQRTQFFINEYPLLIFTPIIILLAGLERNPIKVPTLIIGLCLVAWILYRYIYMRKMTYKITAEQLIYKHGVLMVSSDYIELYRVIDYDEKQTFMQQLLGLKTVTIYSGDHSTPKLNICGISNSFKLIETVRKRVEANKKNKGVYEITNR